MHKEVIKINSPFSKLPAKNIFLVKKQAKILDLFSYQKSFVFGTI